MKIVPGRIFVKKACQLSHHTGTRDKQGNRRHDRKLPVLGVKLTSEAQFYLLSRANTVKMLKISESAYYSLRLYRFLLAMKAS